MLLVLCCVVRPSSDNAVVVNCVWTGDVCCGTTHGTTHLGEVTN